jgi:hypothetical protein
MRASFLLAAIVAALAVAADAANARAEHAMTDYTLGCDSGCGCGQRGLHLRRHCGGHGCGHRNRYEGLDLGFNCGCQGSYNHPVPPQYTYHWPGSVYKLGLMTDYHSPWRFPPIKPYTDEVLVPQAGSDSEATLQPVSAVEELSPPPQPTGRIEPMSSMMQRFFR